VRRATRSILLSILTGALLAAVPSLAPAQAATPFVRRTPLFLVARADSVYVFIDSVAPRGHAWRVVRGDGRVVAEGLEPERSPDRVAERLGDDLALARRLTRADDELTLLRRLTTERAVAYTGLLLSRRIAAMTGRLAVDGAPAAAGGMVYRAELVRRSDGAVRTTFAATLPAARSPATPPTALTGVAVLEGVQLRWRYPAYAGDPSDVVVGYLVERAVGAAGEYRLLLADPILRDDARAPGWLDPDVTDGGSYRYRVRPVLVGGFAGAPGPAITVAMRDRLPPLMPIYGAADVQDGRVRIVWAMSPDADVTGYQVERRQGGADTTWTRLTRSPVAARVPEYVDATVRGGSIYSWRVRAVDDAGNVSPWATPVTARADERTPPDAPRALVAMLGAGRRATYRWQRPAAVDVAGYHVYRGVAGGGTVRLTQLPTASTSFVDSAAAGAGLMPGVTYRIEVVAVDSSSNKSPPVAMQLAVPDDDPPAPPRAVRAQGRHGGSVQVTWTASTALDVAAYEVHSIDAGATPLGARRPIGRTGSRGPFVAVDTAARDGVPLRYAVVAVDSAGNRSPAATDSMTKLDEERPSAPRATWAVRAGADVRLGWERVASRDLAGYVIYRATSLSAQLEEIGRTEPGVQELVDRAAPASVYYAVRAIDRSGNLSIPQGLITPVRGTR
jgi:fibronectin type 3 domain-containing protein